MRNNYSHGCRTHTVVVIFSTVDCVIISANESILHPLPFIFYISNAQSRKDIVYTVVGQKNYVYIVCVQLYTAVQIIHV